MLAARSSGRNPRLKRTKRILVDLEVVTCKYGTHRVLDQPGDLPSKDGLVESRMKMVSGYCN